MLTSIALLALSLATLAGAVSTLSMRRRIRDVEEALDQVCAQITSLTVDCDALSAEIDTKISDAARMAVEVGAAKAKSTSRKSRVS